MPPKIESRHLGEIAVLVPQVFEDERGYFMESFRGDSSKDLGLPQSFVQENHSYSRKGVLRGLHFQWDPPMGKLMRVTRGVAFLVAVDIRSGSPTVGKWFGTEASAENRKLIWAPASFARGFCALSEDVEVQYLCTGVYNSKAESAIRWDDPEIGIAWPLPPQFISEKDRKAQSLAAWLASSAARHLEYARNSVTA
ncbi:MAG TPA: dTDP-4-dehydrorhamnose 3,5-epimerase [Candidatus Acidoferrum sp.]|nr:dTDP-4-dehydrorhamnose 3,5-epimerase [Candidatus Acidoferrum sp.]